MKWSIVLLLPGAIAVAAEVPFERIRDAANDPGSWLTYSGTYSGQRYSPLAQINAANVSGLRPVWMYQLQKAGVFESSPIVADGVMYIVEPPTTVTALDLRSGRRLWSWTAKLPKDVKAIGFPQTNRGVAILDDKVFVATLDAHLVALDAKTGVKRWDVTVADNTTGHAMTLAPLAIDGRIIVGISGAEAGVRGFVDAYAADTGKQLWRFWTVPGPGEPGSETWQGESWVTGGGSTWLTGSYDPELKLLYWGIGNPAPDWNGDLRQGDNLYTCSLVALDPETGKRRWHFQFTPHDTHDWDANQIPILVDAAISGRMRKLVVSPNRNAFYYVLDRVTGEFLAGKAFAKQTWAKGLDVQGRPMVLPDTEPSEKGTLVWPSLQGAVNWYSPSYSPLTGWVYAAVREMGAYYYKTDADYVPGTPFLGGGEQALKGDQAWGAVRALEATTGEIKWEFPLHSPPWAGTMTTAGGLVFGGCNEGNFFALNQRSGKLLWEFQTGGPIRANPISFLIDGRQCVAIAGTHALFVFGLEGVPLQREFTSLRQ
ncbi:MAG: PQQ-dependent dehydrogenase, methanol/ethanol family [Opitutaceae bacterium]|nr:PQQ-dependent dehydrogenase, methanol/ethanol family [Opitutaceae bacterium]